MTESCIFCKIAKKEVPAAVVSESPEWMSFNDTNPQAPLHIVVIPKKHITSVAELKVSDAPLVGGLILEACRIAREKKVHESGYRLVINCQSDGGQTVPHLHAHLIAGRRMKWPPG